MAQPYLPPEAPPDPPTEEEMKARRRFWKRAIWGSSMLTIFPVLLGIGATVVSMNTFSELDRSGAGDTGQLSVQIGVALRATAVGLAVSIVGLVLLVVSIIRYRAIRSMPQQ